MKNSFLEVIDGSEATRQLRRSYSDSELVRASGRGFDLAPQVKSWQHGISHLPLRRSTGSTLSMGSADTCPSPVGSAETCPDMGMSYNPPNAGQISEQLVVNPPNAGQICGTQSEESQWTVGSALHSQGGCTPCVYLNTRIGCLRGSECKFCHLTHVKKHRARPWKSTRSRCKQMVAKLSSAPVWDPQKHQEKVDKLSGGSDYMKNLLKGDSNHCHQRVLRGNENQIMCYTFMAPCGMTPVGMPIGAY